MIHWFKPSSMISSLPYLNNATRGQTKLIVTGGRRKLSANIGTLRSTATAVASDETEKKMSLPRHYSEIPGLKRLPIVGSMLSMMSHKDYNPERYDKFLKVCFATYGPIFRMDTIMSSPLVLLSHPNDIEALYRSTNDNPVKRGFSSVKKVRDIAIDNYFDKKAGLLAENGSEWWRVRSKVQTPMMKPKNIVKYLPQVDKVTTDFIDKILKFQNDLGEMPPNFVDEIYKWSFESVCLIALNRRMGFLGPNLPPDSLQMTLLNNARQLSEAVNDTEYKLKWWKLFPTPRLKRLQKYHESFVKIADTAFSETERRLQKTDHPVDEELTLMETLLRTPGLSRKDVVTMVIDMLFAGIDTTSHTLAFTLYLLAKNPQVQKRLQKEVDDVLGDDVDNGRHLTESHLKRLSYLKACVKESLRLFPIFTGTIRVLQEDLVLSGYKVPKGWVAFACNGVTSLDEAIFSRANEYLPERWGRDKPLGPIHPFASLPFAYGTRMCIGRRIAEQEIYVFLARAMHRLNVEYKYEDMGIITQFLSVPSQPLKFEFSERRK